MLDAVARANQRLEKLGLGQTVCIVYTFGCARLLDGSGKELRCIEGEHNYACGALALELELGLQRLLWNGVES